MPHICNPSHHLGTRSRGAAVRLRLAGVIELDRFKKKKERNSFKSEPWFLQDEEQRDEAG